MKLSLFLALVPFLIAQPALTQSNVSNKNKTLPKKILKFWNSLLDFPENTTHTSNTLVNWFSGIAYVLSELPDFPQNTQIQLSTPTHADRVLNSRLKHEGEKTLTSFVLNIPLNGTHNVLDFLTLHPKLKSQFFSHLRENTLDYPMIKVSGRAYKILGYRIQGKKSLLSSWKNLIPKTHKHTTLHSINQKIHKNTEQHTYSSLIVDVRHAMHMQKTSVLKNIFNFPSPILLPPPLQQKIYYDEIEKKLFIQGILTNNEYETLKQISNNSHYQKTLKKFFHSSKTNQNPFFFKKSILPNIINAKNGNIAFSPHYSYNTTHPIRYTKKLDIHNAIERVGFKPYFAIAIGISGKNQSDILLTSKDIELFFSNPKNIQTLKKGKFFLLCQ